MTRAFSKHINRFAVAVLEKIYSLNRDRLEATCKVMSNTKYEITRHQYKQESETIEKEKIQRDEATSSEMEHTCKHEQRREDTKRRKAQAVKLEGTPSSTKKRFGNLQKHRPQ
ncbi:hypothetical protein BD560DRAFT_428265 [Blakeslea trispora]|nr:hypothetical protein BD560DRAFT_428265 [Blakeslea trispora]